MYSGTGSGPGFAVSAGKMFQSSISGSPSRVVEHIAVDFALGLSTQLCFRQVKSFVTNWNVRLITIRISLVFIKQSINSRIQCTDFTSRCYQSHLYQFVIGIIACYVVGLWDLKLTKMQSFADQLVQDRVAICHSLTAALTQFPSTAIIYMLNLIIIYR
jgi:hypothetical protein